MAIVAQKFNKIGNYLAAVISTLCLHYLMLYELVTLEIMRPRFLLKYYLADGHIPDRLNTTAQMVEQFVTNMIDFVKSRVPVDTLQYLGNDGKMVTLTAKSESHMFDVQHLYDFFGQITIGVVVVFAICMAWIIWKKCYRQLFVSFLAVTFAVPIVILVFLMIQKFDVMGVVFALHRMVFTNEDWILSPSRDFIVRLFDDGFYVFIGQYLGWRIGLNVLLVVGGGIAGLKLGKKRR